MCAWFMGSGMDRVGIESRVVEFQGHKILTISGEIDAYSAPQFRQAVMSVLDGTEQHLIVDMCDVRCIDISGFAVLHSAMKRLNPLGGTLNLVGCTSTMDHLFAISKLSLMVTLDQDINDAMEATCA